MKILTARYPSVFETAFGNTENSAKDQLSGIKIKTGGNWYIVGNLAKNGGINPGRITNTSPGETDFDILFKSSLLQLTDRTKQPLVVTTGFPFSTYNIYKTAAEQFFKKRHFLVEYDTRTFNNDGRITNTSFEIDSYEVIPEIVGCIIGLKKILDNKQPQNFIAISLGFGTIEGGMASGDGLVHRTCFSSHGLQYAIDNLGKELSKKYYLEMRNNHQLDEAMMKGFIYLNRTKIDIKEQRKEILQQYYREVIAPLLRHYFTDRDYERCEKIYLMGGGVYYPEIIDAFKEEYGDSIPVEVAPDPENLASVGYLYNSFRISDKNHQRCAGIDIGNSSTVVSVFYNENSNGTVNGTANGTAK
ncbi:ParM/StbA family protein [Foetidibacter luteolus]|uniref:ParM/StbA family protein n=1 Tax=Foetidibacter luteolus TaxID=2608880 RepID=UPI00129A336F|nr:ParM/StbA family protein [Foetidibacter luteolus]